MLKYFVALCIFFLPFFAFAAGDVEIKLVGFKLAGKDSSESVFKNQMEFELRIAHPEYQLLGFDTKKSSLNHIFLNGNKGDDILAKAKENEAKAADNCQGNYCTSGFSEGVTRDGKLFVKFHVKQAPESLTTVFVDTDIVAKAIKNGDVTKQTIIDNAKITNAATKLNNNDIAIELKPATKQGETTTQTYSISAPENVFIKSIDIMDKEHKALETINVDNGNSVSIDNKYLSKDDISVKVNYFNTVDIKFSLEKNLL